MTGIAEMFAEFSSADEFEVCAQLEFAFFRELENKRLNERRRYRLIKSNPDKYAQLKARKRAWVSYYEKRKRCDDPAWVERHRKRKREQMARMRARRREARCVRKAA